MLRNSVAARAVVVMATDRFGRETVAFVVPTYDGSDAYARSRAEGQMSRLTAEADEAEFADSLAEAVEAWREDLIERGVDPRVVAGLVSPHRLRAETRARLEKAPTNIYRIVGPVPAL